MVFHRLDTDGKQLSGFLIGIPLGHQCQNLLLPFGQRFEGIRYLLGLALQITFNNLLGRIRMQVNKPLMHLCNGRHQLRHGGRLEDIA
ncbi:hypothetical protein D3C81_1991060 [compost metagenome]